MVNADAGDFQQSLRNLWHALCSAEASRGVDLPQLVQQWTATKRESLVGQSSEADFDELCDAGCRPFSLALALAAIEASRTAATGWRKVFGSARHRQQIIRALCKAADALEEVQEKFIDISLEKCKATLDDDLRKSLSADPNLISAERCVPEWPKSLPALPATTIRSLRAFAELFGSVDKLSEETHTHSPASLSKYLISAYVAQATAEFHDREVSAPIGSALDAGPTTKQHIECGVSETTSNWKPPSSSPPTF